MFLLVFTEDVSRCDGRRNKQVVYKRSIGCLYTSGLMYSCMALICLFYVCVCIYIFIHICAYIYFPKQIIYSLDFVLLRKHVLSISYVQNMVLAAVAGRRDADAQKSCSLDTFFYPELCNIISGIL